MTASERARDELRLVQESALGAVYEVSGLGVTVGLTAWQVSLQSPCCGVTMEAYPEQEPYWACDECGEFTAIPATVALACPPGAVTAQVLEAWASAARASEVAPLELTLAASGAFAELAESFALAFPGAVLGERR